MKKKIAVVLFLSLILFGCKKDEDADAGKIKYEAIFTGAGYEDMEIQYTNQYGNTNYITDFPTGSWSQTINGESGEYYQFFVSGYPTSSFTLKTRIYYSGKIVEEQVHEAFPDPDGNFYSISSSLYYSIP